MSEIMDVAPATEPASPQGWISPTGDFGEGVPDDVRSLLEKKKWTNVGDVFKGYSELEKFKGVGKHLVIPEAEDVQGWNDVYNMLGRPETEDKYELNYEGDVELSDELVGSFKKFAHGLGLTQKQFGDVVKFQLDAVKEQQAAWQAEQENVKAQNLQKLKDKYGPQNFESKIRSARSVADKLGIYQTLEAKGLASDPDIISMLETIASRTAEDVITPATPKEPEKSPVQELEEIKKSEAFLKKFHPDHKKIMQRFMELNQMIANSGQARAPQAR